MPTPDNVTSKSPKLRFKDLISSPPVKITGLILITHLYISKL